MFDPNMDPDRRDEETESLKDLLELPTVTKHGRQRTQNKANHNGRITLPQAR